METELRPYKLDFAKLVADKEHAMAQLGNTQLSLHDLKQELEKKNMANKSATNIHQVLRDKREKERDQMMQKGQFDGREE